MFDLIVVADQCWSIRIFVTELMSHPVESESFKCEHYDYYYSIPWKIE